MRISVRYLNRLQDLPDAEDTVVVVDVLRSFTTAAVALAQGARAVYPVEGLVEALALGRHLPGALTVGAIGGGDPAPGFAFGNSPAALATVQLGDRPVVLSTAAGVRGLNRYRNVRHLFAASMVCARATAVEIMALRAEAVCFVITGEWVDRDGDEDLACADYIGSLLRNEPVDAEKFRQRVRNSGFGRRFGDPAWPNLSLGDLDIAADVDRYPFALPVVRENDRLVIR